MINSIEEKYPKVRQKSKTPTFSLTYDGTHYSLMNDIGFPRDEALEIEANYHTLYKVSKQWKEDSLREAHMQGYGLLAFGLRLRCPLYSKSVYGSYTMSNQAKGTARTLGNAFTQSYGLLNNRAVNETMDHVYKSKYRTSIRPCAQIHDSSYYLVKEDVGAVQYLNNNLITAMSWQELEPIKHDEVHLEASLEIYTYRWKDKITLPNYCDVDVIQEALTHVDHQ